MCNISPVTTYFGGNSGMLNLTLRNGLHITRIRWTGDFAPDDHADDHITLNGAAGRDADRTRGAAR